MSSPTILWITTIIMLAGGLLILATGKRRTTHEGLQTALHGIVPIIAACLYFAMATGQGLVILPTDQAVAAGVVGTLGTGLNRIFYFGRYIDWTFTTPLLLVSLMLDAVPGRKRLGELVTAVVLADVIMIATAFAFGASETGFTKWIWFLASCLAFLGVYYVIWVSGMQANATERPEIRANYRRNATFLSVVWLVYPVILAVSPDGLNIVSDAFGVLVIAVLDILAKPIFGFMSVRADDRLTTQELAGTTSTRHASAV